MGKQDLFLKKKAFLLDGSSIIYRGFYAVKDLATSKGMPTGAVFGFLNILRNIIKKENPDYLAVAFDLPKPTFRHEQFRDYKIQRPPTPDALIQQIPVIKELLDAYRIPIYECEGYEADDVLATISTSIASSDIDVYIVSSDKDILQIVADNIYVYNSHKKDQIYDLDYINSKYGLTPRQLLDVMALAGDSADNIPGVPGIGEKTAVDLVKNFGGIEDIIAGVDNISSVKRRDSIKNHVEQIKLYKELIQLKTDVPIDFKLRDMRSQSPDVDKLVTIFRELEFKKLLKEYTKSSSGEVPEIEIIEAGSEQVYKQLRDNIKNNAGFAVSSKKSEDNRLHVCIAVNQDQVYLFNDLDDKKTEWLDSILKMPVKKTGFDIKTQKLYLKEQGFDISNNIFDVSIAAYLLNPDKSSYQPQELIEEFLDGPYDVFSSDLQMLGYEAKAALKLADTIEKKLIQNKCEKLFYDIEMPLLDVLFNMQQNGIRIDIKFLEDFSLELGRALETLKSEIFDLAGEEFNIQSPKQLSCILFEKLKLPVIKKTKTGFSTNTDVLNKLSQQHQLPKLILDFREMAKLKSTYVDSLIQIADKNTNRVHTTFDQSGTRTGRLSSYNPNLQNIPVRTDLGKKIRKAFIADNDKGYDFILSCDYSQIELRILAHLSGDKELKKAFEEEEDIHSYTAGLIYGIPVKDVTKQMRSLAKTTNFGIIYGISSYGLSKDLNIPIEQAQSFIDAYFQKFEGVKIYLDSIIEDAGEKGYVETIFNRRRYLPNLHSENTFLREFSERVALNAPIQGSASDLIKIAMIDIDKGLKENSFKTRLLLQVHDELVFEAPKSELQACVDFIRQKMESPVDLSVPIKVNIKYGKNWLELESI